MEFGPCHTSINFTSVLANSDKPIKLYSLCVISPIVVKYVLSDKLVIFHGVQKD